MPKAPKETMHKIGAVIDSALNMRMTEKQWGFCLIVFPMEGGEGSFVSNVPSAMLEVQLRETTNALQPAMGR